MSKTENPCRISNCARPTIDDRSARNPCTSTTTGDPFPCYCLELSLPEPSVEVATRIAGDEHFANGIFHFNISRALAFLDANPDRFPIELVAVATITHSVARTSTKRQYETPT